MQISRHWRLNALRYRLEGVRRDDGSVSLQERPAQITNNQQPAAQNKAEDKKVELPQRLAS